MSILQPLEILKQSEKIAICCDHSKITYPQLANKIKITQQKLIHIIGQPTNKKIAFLLNNDIDFVTLFLAISSMGAIAIPLDPKWSEQDLAYILQDCDPDLIITNDQRMTSTTNTMTFENLYETAAPLQTFPPVSIDSIFYIGYTSGTTGKPKGYLRTHSSWLHSFADSDAVFQISKDDRVLSPGPLVHSHFLYAAIHALHTGSTLYITRKFDASRILNALAQDKISILYIVPTMFAALYETYQIHHQSISTLNKIISAGAKWQPSVKEKAKLLFPKAEVFEFYGASELSFVSVLDEKGYAENPESVGRPFPSVEVSIRRPNGEEVAIGEVGQLFVKSKQIFHGYVNNPDATNAVIQGEWATVGDLAVRDAQGYITLVGRKNNMIISGGLNVYPEEIEKVLFDHPAICEVLVIGISDSYWGEKVTAVIKWNKGMQLSHEEVRHYCKKHLATYKCPQAFIDIASFPYTSSGKIARKEVIKLLKDQGVKIV